MPLSAVSFKQVLMSLAAELEESEDSLLDVLAFIDSSDTESTITSSDGDSIATNSSERNAIEATSTKRRRRTRKPRAAGEVPQSTRFQREKRDEVLGLREQVIELTARLGQLQRTRRSPLFAAVNGPDSPLQTSTKKSVWEDLASVQFQDRQRAERTNRQLKIILTRQRKLGRSFRKLLEKKESLEGLEFLHDVLPIPDCVQPSPSRSIFTIDISDMVLSELEMNVAALYFQTDSVLQPIISQVGLSCVAQDKTTDPLGVYTEVMTTTPLSCSLKKASEILWAGTTRVSTDPEKVPRFSRARCTNSLARSCKLDLFNTVPMNGLNFVRRYDEADRMVLVSTANWFLPADGLHFQDHVWTVVSRSPVDPINSCIVQSFCRLEAKHTRVGNGLREHFVQAQDYVRGSVARKVRQLQELQQRYMLEQTVTK